MEKIFGGQRRQNWPCKNPIFIGMTVAWHRYNRQRGKHRSVGDGHGQEHEHEHEYRQSFASASCLFQLVPQPAEKTLSERQILDYQWRVWGDTSTTRSNRNAVCLYNLRPFPPYEGFLTRIWISYLPSSGNLSRTSTDKFWYHWFLTNESRDEYAHPIFGTLVHQDRHHSYAQYVLQVYHDTGQAAHWWTQYKSFLEW